MLYKMMEEYENFLIEYPINLNCIGIGEISHIVFNDSPVTNFKDPYLIRTSQLDKACRLHQLNEGWFPSMEVRKKEIAPTTTIIINRRAIVFKSGN